MESPGDVFKKSWIDLNFSSRKADPLLTVNRALRRA